MTTALWSRGECNNQDGSSLGNEAVHGMQFSRMGVILDLILRFVVDFDPVVIIAQVGHEVSSPLIIATIIQKLSWIK